VVLSADAPLLHYHVPMIVDSFARAHRLARLRLLSRRPAETIELVRRNEADLGIVDKRAMPSELKFHTWRVFKSYILIPRGHPLARRGVPTIQDILNEETLLRYPQIVTESFNQGDHRVRQRLERLGLPFNVSLEVGNTETVKQYVARGHGIAAVSGMCLTSEDESIFHIIEIPEELEGETTYGVILRKDKHISPSLRGLLTLLEVPNIEF
jgi:DNA-binding transcriptional LysR family regulator